ncbi:MAG: NPCBM/NEW2 domain-containing protein, partial [Planctomycetes bacterium]|nr:NPCBM/NEW2 domain-containing protein [Planctomycetota bacterium]MCG2685734.1 NPCBM/NEW2 domain-containing protein [Planctomycetales bacterium]
PEFVFVGRITGLLDVKWSDDKDFLPPHGYAYVPLGHKYKLDSGLMQITYDSGAKVILQGPCTYKVESTAGGYLALGKLTARVGAGDGKGSSSKVQGSRSTSLTTSHQPLATNSNPQSLIPNPLFAVRTPTAIVTDLGTEFGVEVDEAGVTESHVFRGKVKVLVLDGTGNLPSPSGRGAGGEGSGREVILRENESARVEKGEGGGGPRLVLHGAAGDPPVFVRRLVRPPKLLDLLDIVAGGNGTRWGRERGIDQTTGMEDPLFVARDGRGDGRYRPVAFRGGLIDGVFVPDGRAGAVQLDSAGHAFDGFPPTDGRFWGSIWARAADVSPVSLNQQYVPWVYMIDRCGRFMPERRGLLCMHANGGITFNLEAMRKMHPSERLARFRAVAGLTRSDDLHPDGTGEGMADVWVLVDGRLKFKRAGLHAQDGPVKVDVELAPADRFLTLVSTDGGNGNQRDRVVFGDPVLQMASTEPEESAGGDTEQSEKKGTGPICRNGPEGASHKLDLSPFSPRTERRVLP